MMSRIQVKRLTAVLLVLALAVAGFSVLALSGRLVKDSSSGAEASAALHEFPAVPADADRLVTWLPDSWQRERVLEPATRRAVEAAYVRAWAAIGRFQATGADDTLANTFTGTAVDAVRTLVADGQTGQGATWALGHNLDLTFYALDGATVGFRDSSADVARTVGSGNAETVLLSKEDFDVVMVLQDGYWRITQMRRGEVIQTTVVQSPGIGTTRLSGTESHAPQLPPDRRSTVYRAQNWGQLNPAALDADFRVVKQLGFAGMRIPLDFVALGGADPSVDVLRDVKLVLDAAAQQQLGVVFVLFDGVADFSPATWPDLMSQAEALAGAGQPLMWDLAEAPDQRTTGVSRVEMRAFLVHAAQRLRSTEPTARLTVTWASPLAMREAGVADLLDAVGLRVSGYSDVAAAVQAVQGSVSGRPVELVVGAMPTEPSWDPVPRTEARQSRAVFDALLAAGMAGIDSITIAELRDRPGSPDGLIRGDGAFKQASDVTGLSAITDASVRGAVPDFVPMDYVTSRFWLGVVALVVMLAWLVRWRVGVRRPDRGHRGSSRRSGKRRSV